MTLGKQRTLILAVFLVTGACIPKLYFTKDHAMHTYPDKFYGSGYFAGLIQFGVEGTYFTPIGIIVGREFDAFPWFEIYGVKKSKALDKLYTVYKRYGSKAIFVKFKGELREGGGVRGDQYCIGEAIVGKVTYFQALSDDQYTALLKYKGEMSEVDKRTPEMIIRRIRILTAERLKSKEPKDNSDGVTVHR